MYCKLSCTFLYLIYTLCRTIILYAIIRDILYFLTIIELIKKLL